MTFLDFYKYHGTGNDFVLLDAIGTDTDEAILTPDLARALCRPHFGIGADGVLLLSRGQHAPYMMRLFNADGSEAEMCGNGIRCLVKYVWDRLGDRRAPVKVETLAGVKECFVTPAPDDTARTVKVAMGAPELGHGLGAGGVQSPEREGPVTLSVMGREFEGFPVGMGNPHFVVFRGLDRDRAQRYGHLISTAPLFPNRTNVEFVETISRRHLRVRVYERGVGLTLACGTGACAVAVAAVVSGRADVDEPLEVELPGGSLRVTVERDLSGVWLEGPAVLVFEGRFHLDALTTGPRL